MRRLLGHVVACLLRRPRLPLAPGLPEDGEPLDGQDANTWYAMVDQLRRAPERSER